jgi:Lar family restriction alleviation protein
MAHESLETPLVCHPCPFCGETRWLSVEEIEDDMTHTRALYVDCGKCCATGPYQRTHDPASPVTERDAIAAWNTRPAPVDARRRSMP